MRMEKKIVLCGIFILHGLITRLFIHDVCKNE